LYFKLLDTCNSLEWKNPFAQSNDCLSGELGISKRKLIQLKNSLKQHGLIDFQSGKVKRELTKYSISGCAKVTQNITQNDIPNITPNNIQNITQNITQNNTPNSSSQSQNGKDKARPLCPAPAQNIKRFTPPLLEEVKNHIIRKNYSVDAETFVAFYTSKNWFVGKNKMKDWRAALLTWHKRNKEQNPTPNTNEIWDNR
jgi:hypothetical protein